MKLLIILHILIATAGCKSSNDSKPRTSKNPVEHNVQSEGKYWEFDTLTIKSYISDSKNKIRLRGSESKGLYFIEIINSKGKQFNYDLENNRYTAHHSYIEWDSDDFVFLRVGCGTGCWTGKLLSINHDKKVQEFLNYVYADSLKNQFVFADSENNEQIYFADMKDQQRQKLNLKLCNEPAIPIYAIDTVFQISNGLLIKYRNEKCEIASKIIEVK